MLQTEKRRRNLPSHITDILDKKGESLDNATDEEIACLSDVRHTRVWRFLAGSCASAEYSILGPMSGDTLMARGPGHACICYVRYKPIVFSLYAQPLLLTYIL